ncbi:SMC-Scp complex subunit ScpB [Candidatus Fermentibacteria bacterium]|nr:MAG: SMC-Scp complex subunit ScpB [Candidatus Fermentibacteria bacterium]
MLDQLARQIEALLVATDEPLGLQRICEITGCGIQSAEQALSRITAELVAGGHAMEIAGLAGGYRIVTDPGLGDVVSQLFQGKRPSRLSRAALETLAVVAYRQPVTRAQMEAVRGVNSDSAVRTLMERGLIRIAGRHETPGRPLLYGTTDLFLEYFGLNSIEDLPRMDEIDELLRLSAEDLEKAAAEAGEGDLFES